MFLISENILLLRISLDVTVQLFLNLTFILVPGGLVA